MAGKTVIINRPASSPQTGTEQGAGEPNKPGVIKRSATAIKWLAKPGFTKHAGLTGLTPFYQFQSGKAQWDEVRAEKQVLKHPAFNALNEKQRYIARRNAIKGFDQATFEKKLTRTFHIQLVVFPVIILLFLLWYLSVGFGGGAAVFFGIMIGLSSMCMLAYLFASYVYMVTARLQALVGIRGILKELARGTHGR